MSENKRWNRILFTLVVLGFFFPFVWNWLWIWMGFGYSLEGVPGSSHDIKEAKERKVFVAKYEISPAPFKVNDSLTIGVEEVWLEYNWRYGGKVEETLLRPEEYQLIIRTNVRKLFAKHRRTWEMEKVDEKAMADKNYHNYQFWGHYDSNLLVNYRTMPADIDTLFVYSGIYEERKLVQKLILRRIE
jgi:hypothetical protein